ncbi:MAG: AAA family ATPase [Candidatus Bathyarchaeota archaeon]|nr:MAG: AAA family ATPase [Candidatus Bathyarchaeota archaeon]
MQRVAPTGCPSIDKLLGGGFPSDGVSLVYGEAETGKTSLAIQCAINCARMGYKSFFIDSDDSFSSRRLSQIAHQDNEKVSPFIYLMKPTTFQEQSRVIDHLEEYTTRKFGLVVIDTIASLYRVKLDGSKLTFALNRELNRQVALLTQFAKTRRVAALIISQVRNVFLEDRVNMEPVASRVLRFWSDIVLKLALTSQTRVIKALLEKHPERKGSTTCYARIEETGIRDYKPSNNQ